MGAELQKFYRRDIVHLTVAIVDYGVGNLGSIANMLKKLGAEAVIAADSDSIRKASAIILPGVGAFDAGMQQLLESGLKESLDEAALHRKIPMVGICLGMQLLFERGSGVETQDTAQADGGLGLGL